MLHFYTLIINYQKEFKKPIPSIIISKIPKNKLNQGGEIHPLKNYKTLMKENEENTNEKKGHIHGLEELILLRCPYYPKQLTN